MLRLHAFYRVTCLHFDFIVSVSSLISEVINCLKCSHAVLTSQWEVWFCYCWKYPQDGDEQQEIYQAIGCGWWISSNRHNRLVRAEENTFYTRLDLVVAMSRSLIFNAGECDETWNKGKSRSEAEGARESPVQYLEITPHHKTVHITSPHLVVIKCGVWVCCLIVYVGACVYTCGVSVHVCLH